VKEKMNQNTKGILMGKGSVATIATDPDASEASWAAHDFAIHVKETPVKPRGSRIGKDYEVRPCKSVRGHVLRLPVTGWVFWFPTVADALSYTRKLAGIHPADCSVYDSEGGVLSRPNLLESPTAPAR
jgi:hypothetical protein